ncbi:endonuclease MutS2 [Sphingobacterium psychroaquaticum]|uniref:DNA mismatch repair protein MutS2 n=1 Tax=Sphingobacterium psychroaquaticum TaxID=561061 RepID=A0A1X7I0X0_9SPHI|nr:DNA mismatch repair protein MutS [Sphingobacterium psychroaquaticum]SMG07831.1 DNA mismatch repair protein MutS2 [Sphingobacterium psychroaquaticum]
MIYPNNFEQRIGIDTIRHYIIEKCLSTLGTSCVQAMSFSTDWSTIEQWLMETEEFTRILNNKETFPIDFYLDMRDTLRQVEHDFTLWFSEEDTAGLMNSLQTLSDIVDFFQRAKVGAGRPKYPALLQAADRIKTFPAVIEQANNILDKSFKIKDNASSTLAQIRRGKIEATKAISRHMEAAMRQAKADGLISKDMQPSVRFGIQLIPVNATHKRKIKGVVHDGSGSGKTVYIEPEAVAEASNKLKELERTERQEVIRILTVFTNLVRPAIQEMLDGYNFLGTIDFIRAKAAFCIRINAVKPVLVDTPQIRWSKAVHPLLHIALLQENKTAHPLDITLEQQARILLISGANAGGKSLCLKTVALLQYMLQCGLLIPVEAGSEAGIFAHILMDIGDGQSMENSLSTYTSHLSNMKVFLQECHNKTLILIDEFGGGTEPQIGGAIAETLLERFNERGCFGIITTHFQNLKHYADRTAGVINGAMLYDVQQMKPCYQLAIGQPGSSYAVEVARNIGLPEDIIEAASVKVTRSAEIV